MKAIKYEGKSYDYEVIVDYMDDAIREDLHTKLTPCTEQKFFDEYLEIDPDFVDRYSNNLYPISEE